MAANDAIVRKREKVERELVKSGGIVENLKILAAMIDHTPRQILDKNHIGYVKEGLQKATKKLADLANELD